MELWSCSISHAPLDIAEWKLDQGKLQCGPHLEDLPAQPRCTTNHDAPIHVLAKQKKPRPERMVGKLKFQKDLPHETNLLTSLNARTYRLRPFANVFCLVLSRSVSDCNSQRKRMCFGFGTRNVSMV